MRFTRFIAVVAVLVAIGAAYWLGARTQDDAPVPNEQTSTALISNAVGAVYLLDEGDIAGARKVLLGIASSALDDVMNNWGESHAANREYLASQCRTLTRLRELRKKHAFLAGETDQALRGDPTIAQAEKRRANFLESIRCQ